jgi:hypothetical protein
MHRYVMLDMRRVNQSLTSLSRGKTGPCSRDNDLRRRGDLELHQEKDMIYITPSPVY